MRCLCLVAAALAQAAVARLSTSVPMKVTLTTKGGMGRRFDGVGAISGGGATSKLLRNYQPERRGEVLDYLFKPNFGASLHILKVEIGGDGQATEGTESSHMHTATDEAYDRGYEWWLMKEAKARNPVTLLYGLPWTFPGWVTESGKGGATGNQDLAAIGKVLTSKAAEYVAKWIDGARNYHNLTIDYIGLWNEHPPTPDYVLLLQAALNASQHGAAAEIVGPDWHLGHGNDTQQRSMVNDTQQYVSDQLSDSSLAPFMQALHNNASVRAAVKHVGFHYPKRLAKPNGPLYENLGSVWSSEESSTTDTPAGGACWGRLLNQNYVYGNITATIMWNLVTSFYTSLPYFGASLMNAGQPWSGHYDVMTPVWATAHHTQFAQPGWTYLSRSNGVGHLPGGGTYVKYVSPGGRAPRDWTIVLEKIRAQTGPCLRDDYTNNAMVPDKVVFTVGDGLKNAAGTMVQVWTSDWSKGKYVQDSDLFQFAGEQRLGVGADGTVLVNITVHVDQVLTLTSLPRSAGFGNHGGTATTPPAAAPFPSHYENNFDNDPLNSDEPYLSDQAGHWEVREDGGAPSNQGGGALSNQGWRRTWQSGWWRT